MIIRHNVFYPETCAERDEMSALKLAVERYCRQHYSTLFANGLLRDSVSREIFGEVSNALDYIDTDEDGRDPSGINIWAATSALNRVQETD